MTFELRPYQVKAVETIRHLYRTKTKKVLLHLPTGSGKTCIFTHIVQGNQAKGKTCFVVTRGKELVYNAYYRMKDDGIDCGIIMAGNKTDLEKRVQIISIDTFSRRWDRIDLNPDLVVIDEAHFAASLQWRQLAERYPNAYYLCVTATPYQQSAIEHVATEIVAPISHQELVDQKYLVPSKVYAPTELDLKGVKRSGEDYNQDELFKAVDKTHIYADVVKYYGAIAEKAPGFCFCVNVAHSEHMRAAFNANGIRSAHADADTPKAVRANILDALKKGELDIVTNCNIFSTGVDVPSVRAIIMARPTQSRILYIQQAGRGTRPSPGKDFFWLMDHANNVRTHGFIEDSFEGSLSGQCKKSFQGQAPTKTCPECFAVVHLRLSHCSGCGYEFPGTGPVKMDDHAQLEELQRGLWQPIDKKEVIAFFEQKDMIRRQRHYSPWWTYYQVREKFGDALAKQFLPRVSRNARALAN